MTQESRLPAQSGNLFQLIKQMCTEAQGNGKKIWPMTIGAPTGPALLSAREVAAGAVMSGEKRMHEYQDNSSPGVPDFAPRFIQAHTECNLSGHDIGYLPIPGTKPMLGLIPMACGGHSGNRIKIRTMTDPGYPTPAVWARFLNQDCFPLEIHPGNKFYFSLDDVNFHTDLLMLNYPHNPSGQIATREYWKEVCAFCEKHNIRVFNDAAYAILVHSPDACTLVEVAVDFPNLSWAEAFSASKVINNGTGWRVGAICGSPDFVRDIATIKGETDSGFVAPMAAGALHAMEHDQTGISECREMYRKRIELLTSILRENNMELAVEPKAGFFTLWKAPTRAFGVEVQNGELFNQLMIEKTGLVGVHFGPYIRYAVTAPVDESEFTVAIQDGFTQAKVQY